MPHLKPTKTEDLQPGLHELKDALVIGKHVSGIAFVLGETMLIQSPVSAAQDVRQAVCTLISPSIDQNVRMMELDF